LQGFLLQVEVSEIIVHEACEPNAVDLSVLGFSEKELAAALLAHASGLTDEDQIPEIADVAVSQTEAV